MSNKVVDLNGRRGEPAPKPVETFRKTFRMSYGYGVEAGVIICTDQTATVFRQINGDRVEAECPDFATGVAVLLVVHQEIKAAGLDDKLSFAQPEAELMRVYSMYGPKFRDFVDPSAPLVMDSAGLRGRKLKKR